MKLMMSYAGEFGCGHMIHKNYMATIQAAEKENITYKLPLLSRTK
jgi:hypothetical protein